MRISDMSTAIGPVSSRGTPMRVGGQDFAAAMATIEVPATPATTTGAAGQTEADAAAGSTAVDFTSMTRKDLFDWMNDRIKSGEMSLDDSSGFLGMTLHLPADAGIEATAVLDDQEKVDFVQEALRRRADALDWRDYALADRMTTTLAIMREQQATTSGTTPGWA